MTDEPALPTEPATDINELFNRDPLELTKDDITEVIKHMRAKRASFIAAPSARPKAASKKLTPAQQAAKALTLDFKL